MEIRIAGLSDIEAIRDIAERTWWPTYGNILSEEQLRYMLDSIYSKEAMERVMVSGEQEFLVLEDKGIQGFASFGVRPKNTTVAKLHKLYVLPGNHGKGYGKALLNEVKQINRDRGIVQLDLNVNRYNPARSFYEKSGFKIARAEDVPIGPFWMNDFVMECRL